MLKDYCPRIKLNLFFVLALFFSAAGSGTLNDSSTLNDFKIAKAVRQAVRDADPELLKSTSLDDWRDYLKIAALELDIAIQPLVLIKFDQDVHFRNQLKAIIAREQKWKRQETEHYIYYYLWDEPIPVLTLEVQDVHFRELAALFSFELEEKIPYRYDLQQDVTTTYSFDNLQGGLVSPYPFDFEKAAYLIFQTINPDMNFLTIPLSRIYGTYFQNETTASAYYEKCIQQIKKRGYIAAANLMHQSLFEPKTPAWFSAYALAFALNHEFGPQKLSRFLTEADAESFTTVEQTFKDVFGVTLSEFELRFQQLSQANGDQLQ